MQMEGTTPGTLNLDRVVKTTPSNQSTLPISPPVNPPKYDIPKEVQRPQEKGIPVSEGTVFLNLVRKGGLQNLKDISEEEHLTLVKISNLNPSKTNSYPFPECKEELMPILREVPVNNLKHWKDGEVLIQMKDQTPGKGEDKMDLEDSLALDIVEVVWKICGIITMCHSQALSLVKHHHQAPTAETKKEPKTKQGLVHVPWTDSDTEPMTTPKCKKKKKRRKSNTPSPKSTRKKAKFKSTKKSSKEARAKYKPPKETIQGPRDPTTQQSKASPPRI